MTLLQQIGAARAQRARAMPHGDLADTLTLTGGDTGGYDEAGNEIPTTPGTSQPSGVPLPCLATRMTAEDATQAGLSSTRELWRVTINYRDAVTPTGHLRVTKADGRVFDLSILKVEGTDITTVIGERV